MSCYIIFKFPTCPSIQISSHKPLLYRNLGIISIHCLVGTFKAVAQVLKANIRKRTKKVGLYRHFSILISITLTLLKMLPCLCFGKFQGFPQGIFTCPIWDFRNIFKNFPESVSILAAATFSFFLLWVRWDTCHIPNYSFALWICLLLWWPENVLAEGKTVLFWGGGVGRGRGRKWL